MSKVDVPVVTDAFSGLVRKARRSVTIPDEVLALLLSAADAVVIISSMIAAQFLYWDLVVGGHANLGQAFWIGAVVAVIFVSFQYSRDVYAVRSYVQTARQSRSAFFSWSASFFVIAWLGFLLKITEDFSRGSLTLFFVIGLLGVLVLRYAGSRMLSRAIADGGVVLRKAYLVTVEGANDASEICRRIAEGGVEVAGVATLSADPGGRGAAVAALVAELRESFAREHFQDVYLFLPWHDWSAVRVVSDALRELPVSVYLVADGDVADVVASRPVELNHYLACPVQRAPLTSLELLAKRSFDIVVASMALLLVAPLLLVTTIAILVESGRPVIFCQQRKGFGGRPFTIFKFRTMNVCEDGDGNFSQATRRDARVTALGRLLRRTSIDELPQLLNVLRGDMSLIGPRPHPVALDTQYYERIASYASRHHVKPGLTGWAQVHGYRGETREFGQMEGRVQHDLWYVDNWSLWLDVQILLRTVVSLFFHENAY